MVFTEFIGDSYQSRARTVSTARSINLYAERVESNGKSGFIFHGTPGHATFVDLSGYGAFPPAWLLVVPGTPAFDRLFLTIGEHLLEIDVDGVVIHDFEPATPTGQPFGRMIYNGFSVFVDGGNSNYFVYNIIGGWTGTPIANATGTLFETLDGYIIAAVTDSSSQFFISGINDAETWDPLDFGTADRIPGTTLDIKRQGDLVWFFRTSSIEGFEDTGNPDFPFESVKGALIHLGVVQGSVARIGNSTTDDIMFLARLPSGGYEAHLLRGTSTTRISTNAIEAKWNQYDLLHTSNAIGYTEEGHGFYQITTYDNPDSPYPRDTFVFDVRTGQPHERLLRKTDTKEWIPQDLGDHAYAWGRHFVLNRELAISGLTYSSFALFEQSLDFYTSTILSFTSPASSPLDRIRRERIAPYINLENRELFFPGFAIDLDAGEGNDDDPQPMCALSWTNDGDRTRCSEVPRRMGIAGAFELRVRWGGVAGLGKSINRSFIWSSEAAAKIALTNCLLEQPIVGSR